jgi:vitellogenic carboxypeptidase-like protein
MWFWFVPSKSGAQDAPTVMWLQGGPGAPSSYGFFAEIGPAIVLPDGSLKAREEAWNTNMNLLVVDNPSGVGFSPLGSADAPVTNEDQVGAQLLELTRQWALLFPDANAAGLIVAGESYGGKYAPAAAAAIDAHNARNKDGAGSVNMVGLVVADGWVDPFTHAAHYSSMLYGQGLVDAVQRDVVESRMQVAMNHIKDGDLVKAFDPWNSVWRDYSGPYPGRSFQGPGLFENFTGGSNTENIWWSGEDPNIPPFAAAAAFLTSNATRRALHIGSLKMGMVDQYHIMIMSGDCMNSSRPFIEHILQQDKYKVLLYSGAWDGVLGAAVSEPLYASLDWPGKATFNAEARAPYKVAKDDVQVAGFARDVTVGGSRLVRVVVRRAGHILPADQPRVARDMIERFALGGSYQEGRHQDKSEL